MNLLTKMPPNHNLMFNGLPVEPVSRTYQYRKIMKPMLERKRRARINKCLDELKDLMAGTLQADGENVSKLEKADILELTVRHLHRLRERNSVFSLRNEALNIDKFWAGFQHCAAEVSEFLTKYDQNVSSDLIKYIAGYISNIPAIAAANIAPAATTASVIATSHKDFVSVSHKRLQNLVSNQFRLSVNRATLIENDGDIVLCRNPRKNVFAHNPYSLKFTKSDEICSDGESLDGDAASVWRPW